MVRKEYLETDQSIRINSIIYGPYTAAKSLKGSMKIAPIILNTTPSVNPTIANGSRYQPEEYKDKKQTYCQRPTKGK